MKILIIDNYDSFTYNLVHYIEMVTEAPMDVFRNDEISLEQVEAYDKILLSPGPGIPSEAGICLDLIKRYGKTKSIFGVCLGHQAIAEAYGGKILNLDKVYHGISTPVEVKAPESVLYKGLPGRFEVGRYHSWVVAKDCLPESLLITAEDDAGTIMGIRHKEYDVRGVQYHPESVLTEHGHQIIENWINN